MIIMVGVDEVGVQEGAACRGECAAEGGPLDARGYGEEDWSGRGAEDATDTAGYQARESYEEVRVC